MLKIIEVSSDSNIGGAGKCIVTYLKNADRRTYTVHVVLPKDSLLKEEIEALGYSVTEADYLAEKSLDFRAIRVLRRIFRRIQPDVVHTHASMSARLAARSLGIPVVYTRHSVFPPSKVLTRFPGRYINHLIQNLTATRIIAVAEAAKQNLLATGVGEKKIRVILNGVEPLKKRPTDEIDAYVRTWGIRPTDKVVVLAARLNIVKGHTYLIEAAKLLRDRGLPIKAVIAGTGETEEALKAQVKKEHLEDSVIFTGFLKDVAPLMQRMDIQVNCSFGTEATSLSLLEGMSLGKPAVVSDFGGNPGVISDGVNGFVVPAKDAKALADRLETLLTDNDLYQRMAKNASAVFEEKFTAAVNARAVEEIYQEAAKSQHKRRS